MQDDPLLQYKTNSGASSSSSANRKVTLKLENGKGTLPDLQVTAWRQLALILQSIPARGLECIALQPLLPQMSHG